MTEQWGPGFEQLPRGVRDVLLLTEEIGSYEVRRRLGALLRTPLTVQQLRCMTILVVQGTATPQQLSDLLEVTPGTMTGITDRLVRDGMITRHTDDRDGRSRTLTPTEQGQAIVRKLLASNTEADISLLSGLTATELDGLRLGLAGMLRVLRAGTPTELAAPDMPT
jgi:DNA-binding MarR family transcriptional regulator